MKKIVFISIIFSLFLSCKTKKDKAEFYYPRISSFKSDSLLTNIQLDSIENYEELTKILDRITCSGKTPVLKFSNEKYEFNLIVFKICSEANLVADYSKRNVLYIQNDSIIINNEMEKSFNNLKSVLKRHILNPKKESDYSMNVEKAIIFYYQDSLYHKEKIKTQLIKIATEFNQLNKKNGDSLSLKIKMTNYPYIRIETPPFPGN